MNGKLMEQQAIEKRMVKIAKEQMAGRIDCQNGLEPQRETIEYTIGYGDEYRYQQYKDHLTSMQT